LHQACREIPTPDASNTAGIALLTRPSTSSLACERSLLSETSFRPASPTSSRQNIGCHRNRNTRTRYEYQNNTNLEPSSNVSMGRTVDQDVHAAFVEFRAKGNHAHQHANSATAAGLTSPKLTCFQKTTSACLCNASIVSRSERRILLVRSNTFSSAPASRTILMPHVLKQALEMEGQLRQTVSTAHQP
jgi:hypothetical protein